MTQNEILDMFREQADKMQAEIPSLNEVIFDLARLLADSRGKLSKENFDTLVHIGGLLYKEGRSRFQGKTDVDAIMKQSARNQQHE
jgi:prefoldin subunit 5